MYILSRRKTGSSFGQAKALMGAIASLISRILKNAGLSGLLIVCAGSLCYGQRLIFVHGGSTEPKEYQALKIASEFYGVELVDMPANKETDLAREANHYRTSGALGVIVTASFLRDMPNSRQVLGRLQEGHRSIPILVVGVTADVAPNKLREWSRGTISSCRPLALQAERLDYTVGRRSSVTRELADEHIPISSLPNCSFEIENSPPVEPLLSLSVKGRSQSDFRTSGGRSCRDLLPGRNGFCR